MLLLIACFANMVHHGSHQTACFIIRGGSDLVIVERFEYLKKDDFVLSVGVGLQLVAPPPQLAQLVLQAPGQLLSMTLCLP